MENIQTPVKKKKKGGGKKAVKTIVLILVIAAVLAAAAWALWRFVFREEKQEILRDTVYYGSISNQVQGYGYTKARSSATITLASGGQVLDVYVSEGDHVEEGDPLYVIDSTKAREVLEEAEKTVRNYEKQIQSIRDSYQYLTVRPPFAGKLVDVMDVAEDQYVSSGTKIATVVDDSVMKLDLYFNYVYEDRIAVGQTASVSIPVSMSTLSGTVEKIEKVRYVTPEGAVCFQVTVAVPNPGTLAEGMGASAILTSGGEEIYPYGSGTLSYNRKADVLTRTSGDVTYRYLLNYAPVSADTVLMTLSAEDNETELAALENQLKTARDEAAKARENLENYNASAPMSGTVLSCALIPGETVADNTAAIVIADTSVMLVSVNVDERNIGYVTTGMTVDLNDWDGNYYMGTVTNVSLTGTMENGAATFPVTIEVDNSDGTLMSNMSINYSFQSSQADDCLLAPVQAVKNISDETGEPITVVFVEAAERPENAVPVPEGTAGVPTEAEGFYAVPVEVGISDVYHVQILSGLSEGDTVFTSYMTPDQNDYGGGMYFG